MRYALAALMGLIALGGVQARALPGVNNALGKRAPELDFTHISDFPLDDPRNDGIAKRVAVGVTPPPTRPPSTRPNRPRPNREAEDEAMGMEQNDLSDTSDIIHIKPCGAAKRGLEEFEFNAPFDKRMSGQGNALTWEQWQEVLKELDQEFGHELSLLPDVPKEKLRIIWAGGISGIRFGSRGEGGKTGDIDFLYDINTPEIVRQTFLKAIRTIVKNNDKLTKKPLPISASLEGYASDERKKAWSNSRPEPAWEGEHFTSVDGDWFLQLFGKMNRMHKMRSKGSQAKERDVQDAQLFLQKYKESEGIEELTMERFVRLGKTLFEKDPGYTEEMIANTIKLVAGDDMPGVEQKIKDLVKDFKC